MVVFFIQDKHICNVTGSATRTLVSVYIPRCTHAYVVSREAAKFILANYAPFTLPVDEWCVNSSLGGRFEET